MNILLLSAYHAQSHQYWCDGLIEQFPEHQWTLLSLPPRYFSWRIRGNGLSWSIKESERLQQSYDLVLATSMVDLATLRGLVPALAASKNILYFHENQFSYPKSDAQHKSIEPQMVTLYSALAADQLVFNSDYNRTTFLDGVDGLLRSFPDCVPAGVKGLLESKSQVLPVAIAPMGGREAVKSDVLHLVWNHRWEYDKGIDLLYDAVSLLPETEVFKLSILGQSFRTSPAVFEKLKTLLEARGWLGLWGYIESEDEYSAALRSAHVVLSTALHDFQGLAVLQAVSAGCVPLVPDRLAYQEWFPKAYRFASKVPSEKMSEAQVLAARITQLAVTHKQSQVLPPAPDVSNFYWSQLRSDYVHILGL